MMTPCERVYRCLEFRTPDRAPREVWTLPWVHQFAAADFASLLERYPVDFVDAPALAPGDRCRGTPDVRGTYTDAWGSVWSVEEDGVIGEVKQPPLSDWSALDRYQPPWETIRRGTWEAAARACERNRREGRRFMKVVTSIRPFERLQFLRGSEAAYLDLGEESAELHRLLEMIHAFALEELDHWLKLDCDGVMFIDDWGAQSRLLISPAQWRRLFRPLYAEYFRRTRRAGKKVFMHSDGYIVDIIDDLISAGLDALNAQLFCMDIEELGRRFRGRITFWGEIDRQRVLPFGGPDDVRLAVERVRRALDRGEGGVIAQCEWGIQNPPANIAAVFEAWLGPSPAVAADKGLPA